MTCGVPPVQAALQFLVLILRQYSDVLKDVQEFCFFKSGKIIHVFCVLPFGKTATCFLVKLGRFLGKYMLVEQIYRAYPGQNDCRPESLVFYTLNGFFNESRPICIAHLS